MNGLNERSPETATPTTADAESSTLDAFRAALAADESGESQDEGNAGESQQNADAEPGKPKGKPKALKDLAERLGVSDADLYDVEVPMPNGKPVKLGALKDAHGKQADLEVRELQFAERVNKQEAEWTRAQTELSELLSMVDPKAIKPELQQRVRDKVAADVARERKRVLEVIPEWQDQTVREAELGVMVDYLKDFGIHETFLTATMNHKLFRMVRAATLQKQRIERALAKVETVRKPSTTGKSTAGNGAARKPSASKPNSRSSDTRSQFANILRAAG